MPAVSTEHVHRLVERITGRQITTHVLDEPTAVGPFDEQIMNEYAEIFYQHRIPQNMISESFERFFGWQPSPLVDGLRATLDWYDAFLAAQSNGP